MRIKGACLLAMTFIVLSYSAQMQSPVSVIPSGTYHSPMHGSELHHPTTQIILRPGCPIGVHTDQLQQAFDINGDLSGSHDFDILVAPDKMTLTVIPKTPFSWSEAVTVSCTGVGSSCLSQAFFWNFKIADEWIVVENEDASLPEPQQLGQSVYPELEVLSVDPETVYDANIFVFTQGNSGSRLGILSPLADPEPVWWTEPPFSSGDFKINRNGLPTYYNGADMSWRMMNTEGVETDAFYMVSGYQADEHDFQILPMGNYLMFAYDVQNYDMSEVVDGGNPNAQVEGFVIQEFNANGQLIFQWRSWDYLEVSDNEEINLLLDYLAPFHINTIQIDSDDNLLISCRHTNEITKITRFTGEIIWRFGLYSWNQFTFLNDNGFSYQHDVRRLDNGNLLLFDNANKTGQISRAVEYSLDTVNWQAIRVWQYIHPEELFGASRGGCQRLPNGNTIIHWGAVALDKYGARSTEVTAQGQVALEFAYSLDVASYRTPKHDWFFGEVSPGCPDPDAINFEPDADYFELELCQYDADGDGFSPEMGDCNDNDDSIYPDAEEIPYDNIDQDCNGSDLNDLDGDGFSGGQGNDCDDTDASINPDADEIPYDGIDQDCDGEDLTDVDGDGISLADGDCNDDDDSIFPGADEVPYDGIDQDCDGEDLTDVDGDGFSPDDGDCNDDDEDINPDTEEIPNDGIDQDCDGNDLVISVPTQEQIGNVIIRDTQLHFVAIADFDRLEIRTIEGRLVMSNSFTSRTGVMDCSGLSEGVYLAVFIAQAGRQAVKFVLD